MIIFNISIVIIMMKSDQFSEPASATVDMPADKRHNCVAQISLVVIKMIIMMRMIVMTRKMLI